MFPLSPLSANKQQGKTPGKVFKAVAGNQEFNLSPDRVLITSSYAKPTHRWFTTKFSLFTEALKFICIELLLQKNWDLPPKPGNVGVAQPPEVDPLQENLVPVSSLPEAGNKLPSAYQAAGFFFFFSFLRLMITALKRELN